MNATLCLLRKSTIIVGIFCYACGVGSGGASNPNSTAKEFSNPTGTLLTSNIDDIVIAGVYAVDSIRYRDPETLFSDADFESCKYFGDTETAIDWPCAFRNIEGCSARGVTILTDDPDDDFTQVDYEGVDIECTGTVKIPQQKIDGQINTSRIDSNVFCVHLDRSEQSIENDSNACTNSIGQKSVRFDGQTYVVGTYTLDPLCGYVTTTIRDKEKTRTVKCEITKSSGTCGSLSSIETVDNCSVQ